MLFENVDSHLDELFPGQSIYGSVNVLKHLYGEIILIVYVVVEVRFIIFALGQQLLDYFSPESCTGLNQFKNIGEIEEVKLLNEAELYAQTLRERWLEAWILGVTSLTSLAFFNK